MCLYLCKNDIKNMNSDPNDKTVPMNHSSSRLCTVLHTHSPLTHRHSIYSSCRIEQRQCWMLNVSSTSENEMIINYSMQWWIEMKSSYVQRHIHICIPEMWPGFLISQIKSCSLFIILFPFNPSLSRLLKWISVLCRHISWYV